MDYADRAQQREQAFLARALESRERPPAERPLIIKRQRCCRDCEQPLGKARLKAHPDAARCVECQTEKERQDRRVN